MYLPASMTVSHVGRVWQATVDTLPDVDSDLKFRVVVGKQVVTAVIG